MTTASANRTMAGLKRALNLFADRSDAEIDRRTWEIGLAPFDGVKHAKHVALADHIIASIVAAARKQSPEFGNLVQLLAETGSRYSQLTRCVIADLDADEAVISIPVSAKGRGVKEVQSNELAISAGLAARLRVVAGDRPVTEPLLLRPDGQPWRHSDESQRFADAVTAAGQDATAITAYALRHSWILGRLKHGMPVRLVAQLSDTSLAMLERHYSVSIGKGVRDMQRDALPNVEPATADVVQLHR
jgi:integrase